MLEDNKKQKTYIGITGFMDRDEVGICLEMMPKSSKKLLMVGALVNDRTLQCLDTIGGRHPNVKNIKDIFVYHPLVLNMVHFHTKETDRLCDQLIKLTELGGPNLHGFQFNMIWPPIDEIKKYRSKFPNNATVLTIDGRALDQIKNSNTLLISKVSEYKGLIDYILLDKSCGYGIPLDVKFMREYIHILHDIDFVADSTVKIVIAGGLNAKILGTIEQLIKDFPDLSIDAENNIRNKDDSLNLRLSQDYLYRALQMFGEI